MVNGPPVWRLVYNNGTQKHNDCDKLRGREQSVYHRSAFIGAIKFDEKAQYRVNAEILQQYLSLPSLKATSYKKTRPVAVTKN